MELRLWSRVGLVVISAAVLQVGVMADFRVMNVSADLLLLAAIASAMVVGSDRGAVAGFACGLLLDLLTHSPFGLYALSYCLVGYFLGRFDAMVVRSSRLTVMLTGFAGTAFGTVGYGLLGSLLGMASPPASRVATIALLAGVWNGLLTPTMVRVMRWAWRAPVGLRLAYSSSSSSRGRR